MRDDEVICLLPAGIVRWLHRFAPRHDGSEQLLWLENMLQPDSLNNQSVLLPEHCGFPLYFITGIFLSWNPLRRTFPPGLMEKLPSTNDLSFLMRFPLSVRGSSINMTNQMSNVAIRKP
jgi:hypothetical protein